MGNVFVHFIMYFVARARPCDGSIKSEASFFVNTRHLKVFFTVNCRRYRLFSLFIGVNVVHKNVPQTDQIAMSDFNQREKKRVQSAVFVFRQPDSASCCCCRRRWIFCRSALLYDKILKKGSDRLMRAACAIYYAETENKRNG